MTRVVQSVTVAVALVVAPQLSAQHSGTAFTYAVITDTSGTPVPGLSAADFVVQLNGAEVPVTAAAAATEPLSLVFLTSGVPQAGALETRRTMEAILDLIVAHNPESRVGLMLEQGGPAPVMHNVRDADGALKRSISHFVGSHDTAPLLESIITAARTLRTEPTSRRVILALSEGDKSQADVAAPNTVFTALREAGASLWSLDYGWGSTTTTSEQRVLTDGARMSGGRRDALRPASMPGRINRLVEAILSQYSVSFTVPPGLSLHAQLRVGVRRDKGTVLAPVWMTSSSRH